MEASTFDGVFVWKISDFTRKRQEAVAGRTPAIFSPGADWNLRPHVPVLPAQPPPPSLSRPAEARSHCAALRAGVSDQPSCGGSSAPTWAPGPLQPLTPSQRGHQAWQLRQAGLPSQACSCGTPCPLLAALMPLERSVWGGESASGGPSAPVCPLSPGRRWALPLHTPPHPPTPQPSTPAGTATRCACACTSMGTARGVAHTCPSSSW